MNKHQGSSLIKFVEFAEKFLRKYEAIGLRLEVYDNNDTKDLRDVVALDQELFASHEPISLEDIQATAKKGLVLGVRDSQSRLVAEASLLLESDSAYGKSQLECHLPDYMAYCNGSAVAKLERGKGLEKQLLRGREIRAIELGKEAISVSVRHRNLPSIQSLMAEGYAIVSNASDYFGGAIGDGRLVMVKLLRLPSPMDVLRADNDDLSFDSRGITELVNISNSIEQKRDIISLGVENSTKVNMGFNEAVGSLLEARYVGVACHYFGVADSEGSSSSIMVFIRLDSSESDVFPAISEIQDQLKEVFIST